MVVLHLQQCGCRIEVFLFLLEFVVCLHLCDGSDTADTGTDGFFGNDLERSEVACICNMGAAAEFLGEVAHGDNSDLIAILLIKQSGCAGCLGCFDIEHLCCDRNVLIDLLVDNAFNFLQLRIGRLFEMCEVETSVFRTVVGTGLGNMITKNLFQSCLQQME